MSVYVSYSNFPYPAVSDMVFVPDTLAYLTAKTNSMDHLAAGILETARLTEADIDTFGASTYKPPRQLSRPPPTSIGHLFLQARTSSIGYLRTAA